MPYIPEPGTIHPGIRAILITRLQGGQLYGQVTLGRRNRLGAPARQ